MYSYAGIEGTPGSNCTNLEGLTCDMSKKGFRLATEEEWEYACRGSETGDYYWGASAGGPDGWYQGNSGGTSRTIASVRPNSFGLYDMAGNVWEWCNDWYGGYNPDERIDITGPSEGREKVLRGGGFQSAEGAMRSSNRFSSLPLYRSRDLGFRTVYRNWAVE
jgi:formylglycine-generating enzyme required for sulfatase activity